MVHWLSHIAYNERTVEVPWLAARLADLTPRTLLDVGHADSFYWPALRATGAHCVLCDVRPFAPLLAQPGDAPEIHVVSGAALPAAWAQRFDVTVSVSTIDHMGLTAYGQPADAAALPLACAELWRVTAPGGVLLLTTPAGRDLWTTHPGGGQRVFSLAALRALFPAALWAWQRVDCWRFDPAANAYAPTTEAGIAEAGYLGDRGDGVVGLVLRRAP